MASSECRYCSKEYAVELAVVSFPATSRGTYPTPSSRRICNDCLPSESASSEPPARTIDDGGPWYPASYVAECHSGVSVRMRVAAMCLAADLSTEAEHDKYGCEPNDALLAAGRALMFADALITAEKVEQGGPTVAESVDLLSACRGCVSAINEVLDRPELPEPPVNALGCWINVRTARNLAIMAIENAEKKSPSPS